MKFSGLRNCNQPPINGFFVKKTQQPTTSSEEETKPLITKTPQKKCIVIGCNQDSQEHYRLPKDYNFCKLHLEELLDSYKYRCLIGGCHAQPEFGDRKCTFHKSIGSLVHGSGDPDAKFFDFDIFNLKIQTLMVPLGEMVEEAINESKLIYIGCTKNLHRRLQEHSSGQGTNPKNFDHSHVISDYFPNRRMACEVEAALTAKIIIEALDNKPIFTVLSMQVGGGGGAGTIETGGVAYVYFFKFTSPSEFQHFNPNLNSKDHLEKVNLLMEAASSKLVLPNNFLITGITQNTRVRENKYMSSAHMQANKYTQHITPILGSFTVFASSLNRLTDTYWPNANSDDIKLSEIILHSVHLLEKKYFKIQDKIITRSGGGEIHRVDEETLDGQPMFLYYVLSSTKRVDINSETGEILLHAAPRHLKHHIIKFFGTRIPIDKFECELCSFTTTTLAKLAQHKRSRHAKTTYSCPVYEKYHRLTDDDRGCDYTPLDQKNKLITHMKTAHKECEKEGTVPFTPVKLTDGSPPSNFNFSYYCPKARVVEYAYEYHIRKKFNTLEDKSVEDPHDELEETTTPKDDYDYEV